MFSEIVDSVHPWSDVLTNSYSTYVKISQAVKLTGLGLNNVWTKFLSCVSNIVWTNNIIHHCDNIQAGQHNVVHAAGQLDVVHAC